MAKKRAAAEAGGGPSSAAPTWTIFVCEGRRFGFPLERVLEILMPGPLTRLPGCGPEVLGLTGIRGRIVTAFDLGAALGLRPAAEQPDHRLLLIECGDHVVAGAVDEVLAVRTAAPAPPPKRGGPLRGLKLDRDAVVGVGETTEGTFVALDSDRILGDLLE